MGKRSNKRFSRDKTFLGGGLLSKIGEVAGTVVNRGIDLLPIELHLPGGYRYCGPGTRLRERLARGDQGINPLDEACKIHDIAYSNYSDSDRRRQADRDLAERAWRRFKAKDSSVGERAAAWAVTAAMKAKAALGSGRRKKKIAGGGKRKKGRGLYLKPYPKQGAGKKSKRTAKKKKKRTSR